MVNDKLRMLIAVLVFLSTVPAAAADAPTVSIVVLKEHGVGSPALAQPYLDRFIARAAKQNDWAHANGRYFTSRSAAEEFIGAEKPHYGILSLPAFLALRRPHALEVIGRVAVKLVGGRRYHVISTSASDLGGCKGKRLASDHADDARFIERVVARGAFKLADFTLVQTQRPLQTIKKLLAGEATCALIDDAQQADLAHLQGAEAVRSVWQSEELPPMAAVAFPAAPADERKRFQKNLEKLCSDDGKGTCAEVGIVALEATVAADYAAVVSAYGE